MSSPSRTPNRYELPWVAMVGAMVVVLAAVGLVMGWRALNHDDAAVPVQTVDYHPWLRAARADGVLQALAPRRLPQGWRATSASYDSGTTPHWHLGMLTAENQYVGLDEEIAPRAQMVQQYVGGSPHRAGSLQIGGVSWQVWHNSRGDYGLVRELKARKGPLPETVVVDGSATPAQVRAYVASLTTR